MDIAMSKKILIVDDDPAFCRLLEQLLSQQGFDALKAVGGQECLKLLFAEKPDLVLLDVSMPGMDGWQTCQRIRRNCRCACYYAHRRTAG